MDFIGVMLPSNFYMRLVYAAAEEENLGYNIPSIVALCIH